MNKYEKLIEYIINDEESKARELFHEIVVDKSRDIYESLMDQEQTQAGGNQVEDLVDEITSDEEGISEDDLELDGSEEVGAGEDGAEFDYNADGELDAHEEEHASDEERIQDLEDALEELKAEFDALLADEEGEDHDVEAIQAADDEEVSDEEGAAEFGADVEEAAAPTSDVDLMREYVEKVGNIYGGKGDASEGEEVAAGKSVAVNKGSVVAGKNDMGGSTANIAKGGAEGNPDGTSPSKANNAYTKGQGTLNTGNRNVPGGKAGNLEKAPSAKTGEVGGTNTKSIEG